MNKPKQNKEPLTVTSLEVLLAKAFLKKVCGDAYTDDIMDEVIKEQNEKRKAA